MTQTVLPELTQLIALDLLHAAPWNARKTHNEIALAELVESVKQHGILVPLIVRPWTSIGDHDPDGPDYYEIVAGHRRHMAAFAAGLEEVPCAVRDLTDEEAREIGLVDNLQRENVPAMEEAVAFSELLTRLGSIEAVAARVQKDQGYVAKRLKLCSLSLCGCDALRAGLITVDHALLLARLGADEQDKALKWTLDRSAGVKKPVEKVIEERLATMRDRARELAEDPEENSYYANHPWEPESVAKLKGYISEDSGTELSRAPWDLDLPGLGGDDIPACSACPQNTSANAPLFGDLVIGEPKCTDGGCFKEKTQAFIRIQARVAPANDAPIRVSWKQTATAPRMEKDKSGPSLTQVFKEGQWTEAKKNCDSMRLAVTVDWSEDAHHGFTPAEDGRKPGEILKVCIDPKCKVHKKRYGQEKRESGTSAERKDPERERVALETIDFREKVEEEIRAKIWDAMVPKLDAMLVVKILASAFAANFERKDLKKKYPKASAEMIDGLLALEDFRDKETQANFWNTKDAGQVAEQRKELWAAAKLVGVNADQVAAKYFHDLGSIAPAADILYPKNIPWPKADAKPAAKKSATKLAKKAVKKAAKKAGRK